MRQTLNKNKLPKKILLCFAFLVILVIVSTISYNKFTTHRLYDIANVSYSVGSDFVEFRYIKYRPNELPPDAFFTISKEKFPKLFNNLNNGHEVMIKPFYERGHLFYVIANVFPDHGAISYEYAAIIDVFNNSRVLYETNSVFGTGNYSKVTVDKNIQVSTIFKSSYTSQGVIDGYELVDYLDYDSAQAKFVTDNVRHKQQIKNLFANFKKTGKNSSISENNYSTLTECFKKITNGTECSLLNLKSP